MSTTVFKDIQGKTIKLGDRVAYASYKNLGMTVGTVTKIGRLNVHVTPAPTAFNPAPEFFRPNELVKLAKV